MVGDRYWEDTKSMFGYLYLEKQKDAKWSDLSNKEDDVYI